jgi:hypothetical protein
VFSSIPTKFILPTYEYFLYSFSTILIIENKKQLIALKKNRKFSYKIAKLNLASLNGCLTYYILILQFIKM